MSSANAERPIDQVRLDGGRPCLDFVNSIHDRHAAPREDYLTTPQRFFAWSARAGLLDHKESGRLKRRGVSGNLISEIGSFRERLYELFCARIDGAEVPATATRELDRWLHRAWRDLSLDPRAAGCLSWHGGAFDAHLPLKRIALSALELLRDGDPQRLKRCSAQGECGWLFFDDTRNNQRRWCAMETCGTIAKMRRYRGADRRGQS